MSSASEPDSRPPVVPAGRAGLPPAARAVAMARYEVLAPHLHDDVPLARLAERQHQAGGVSYRTLQRWLAGYRAGGLDGLARASRADKGLRRFPGELVAFIEGLALRRIERVLKINKMSVVTKEVVETARKNLVIGPT